MSLFTNAFNIWNRSFNNNNNLRKIKLNLHVLKLHGTFDKSDTSVIYKWLKIKNAEPFSLYVLSNLIIIMLVYLQLQEKQIFIMSFSENSQQR